MGAPLRNTVARTLPDRRARARAKPDRRAVARVKPGYRSRKGEKLVDGLSKAELVAKFEPMVRIIAQKIAGSIADSVDVQDLISVGFIGLMDAADRYEASRGVKFQTYAEWRIRGSILDELRNQDWVPHSARRRAKALETTAHSLERELGRKPSEEELASRLQLSREELREEQLLAMQMNLVRFGDLAASDEEEAKNASDLLPDQQSPDPCAEAERRASQAAIQKLFLLLPEDARQVLSCYYLRGLRNREIADIMEVSESRVSQIHTKAILSLKQRLAADDLHDMRSMFLMLLEN